MVTSRQNGHPLFYCFTSNGGVFEHEKPYDKFGVYTRLQHRGNSMPARALGEMGYGKQERAMSKSSPGKSLESVAVKNETSTPADPANAVSIITEHFRKTYRPDFRRGNSIHTETGEIVPMGVACEVCTSMLIEQLAGAIDAPRFAGGGIKRDSLPGFFKKWAKVAPGVISCPHSPMKTRQNSGRAQRRVMSSLGWFEKQCLSKVVLGGD